MDQDIAMGMWIAIRYGICKKTGLLISMDNIHLVGWLVDSYLVPWLSEIGRGDNSKQRATDCSYLIMMMMILVIVMMTITLER